MPTVWVLLQYGCLLDSFHSISMHSDLLSFNHACPLLLCSSICHTCWYGVSLSACWCVVSYRPCFLVWCLTISNACWCGASLKVIPAVWCLTISDACWLGALLYVIPFGVVPLCRPGLLVWCLTIDHACWYGISLSAISAGVVPHIRTYLLAWNLTIGDATATNILLVECWWKKGGYKSVATWSEVPLHQTCLLIWGQTQTHLLVQRNSVRHACWVNLFRYSCL